MRQHYPNFKLSLIVAALAAALSGCASIIPHSQAGGSMQKDGDGFVSNPTNVVAGDSTGWTQPEGRSSLDRSLDREAALEGQAAPVVAGDSTGWTQEDARSSLYHGAAYEEPAIARSDIMVPLLPMAKAGECYARIWNEPTYDTRLERLVKQPASERTEIIPARYEKVSEQVVVKEASTQIQIIPAEYETVTERMMVKPAYTKTVAIPATYDTFTEQVLVRPAYTTWMPGDNGGITKIDESTGELMCLVEMPAEYKTVSKNVLRTAATTKSIEIPAEYSNVEKRVMKTPERTIATEVPAKYEMREVTKLVAPASEVRVPVEAVYEDVSTKVLVADGSYEWRSVLCKTNSTEAKITEIQQALKSRGFYAGELDGKLGPITHDAVQAFQEANGLPTDRFLNIETVNALGVNPT